MAKAQKNKRKALLLGATGLVGHCLLEQLLTSGIYQQVITVSRRAPSVEHPQLVARLVDFRSLEKTLRQLVADDCYCCLGTTLSKAGSKETFRRVDLEYPLLAATTLAKSVEHYLLVSALGANVRSPFFYNRVKGELEQALLALDLPFLTIARPSLLLGKRQEARLLESTGARFMQILKPVFAGPLAGFAGVEASKVASALLSEARAVAEGRRSRAFKVLDSAAIQRVRVD